MFCLKGGKGCSLREGCLENFQQQLFQGVIRVESKAPQPLFSGLKGVGAERGMLYAEESVG